MENITIGLWVSSGMLMFVVLGMRVAFAAGLAGFLGLVWLRWNSFDYDPDRFFKALEISVKVAGLTPHSKVSSHVFKPNTNFYFNRLLGILCKINICSFCKLQNVGLLGSRRISCFNCFCPLQDLQLFQVLL